MGVLGSFGASAGMRFERPGTSNGRGEWGTSSPAGTIPTPTCRTWILDGVHANILYPSIGLEMFGVPETTILRDIFAAYNDWLSDFCSTYPQKLKGIAMLLLDDEIEAGISDLRKAADAGFAAL